MIQLDLSRLYDTGELMKSLIAYTSQVFRHPIFDVLLILNSNRFSNISKHKIIHMKITTHLNWLI